MLRGFAAVAASSVLSGCGAALARPESAATVAATSLPLPQPVPMGALTAASVTVTADAAGLIGADFLGLAYEKQALLTPLFTAANTDLVGLFRLLGPGVLRLGGASVDQRVWAASGSGQVAGQITPGNVDALAGFLRATGWSCLYGINLGGSASGATTPALAAAEVAYVTAQLGSALLGVQLGNACEAYGSTFYAGDWSVEVFEALWEQYRSAIVAVTPSALICGPAAASDLDSWTLPFGEFVGSETLNLLTQQFTGGSASGATVSDLITPDAAVAAELLILREGAQSIGVPFRIDSIGTVDGGDGSGTYASALWAMDTFFQAALAGASGLNFVSGGQQSNAAVADDQGKIVSAQPMFYGLLLASMTGAGTMLATALSASEVNVTAYAVRTASGMSVVLVNKDSTQNLDVRITLPQAMATASLRELTQSSTGAAGASLAAASGIAIQGASVGVSGGFSPNAAYALTLNGTQLSCYVPALSAVLIQVA
jgi:hypothetical protein